MIKKFLPLFLSFFFLTIGSEDLKSFKSFKRTQKRKKHHRINKKKYKIIKIKRFLGQKSLRQRRRKVQYNNNFCCHDNRIKMLETSKDALKNTLDLTIGDYKTLEKKYTALLEDNTAKNKNIQGYQYIVKKSQQDHEVQLKNIHIKNEKDIADLKDQNNKLENKIMNIKKEREDEMSKQLQTIEDLKSAQEEKIKELHKNHEDKIKTTENENNKRNSELQLKNDKIKELLQKNKEEISKLQKEKNGKETELAALTKKHENEIKIEIKILSDEYNKTEQNWEVLQVQHEESMNALRAEHGKEIEKLEKLQKENMEEIILAKITKEVSTKEEEFNKKIKEKEQEIQDLNSLILKQVGEKKDLKQKLTNAKNEIEKQAKDIIELQNTQQQNFWLWSFLKG